MGASKQDQNDQFTNINVTKYLYLLFTNINVIKYLYLLLMNINEIKY